MNLTLGSGDWRRRALPVNFHSSSAGSLFLRKDQIAENHMDIAGEGRNRAADKRIAYRLSLRWNSDPEFH